MKLKLIFLVILAAIVLLGLKSYRDTSALKSIDSYESCVAAKGSRIQESYPATCVTALGARFTQPLNDQKQQLYKSEKYKYEFEYPTRISPYDYSLREYTDYERHDFGSCGSMYVGDASFASIQVTENIPFKYLDEISKLSVGKTKNYSVRLANNLPVEFIAERMSNAPIAGSMWISSKNVSKNEDIDLASHDKTYYTYLDKNLYVINISAQARCQDYNQILSTFKFTN